jgi:hypothetical protein
VSGDVERLAEALPDALGSIGLKFPVRMYRDRDTASERLTGYGDVIVNAVLASSWLAAHDAEVAARALREAARYFEYEMPTPWGRDERWISTGSHVADLVGGILRGMAADRVAGHAQEDE